MRPTFQRCDFDVVAGQADFIRGDSNSDGRVDLSDALFTLGCKFLGEKCPTCRDAADANDDGVVDISDPVRTLGYLFLGFEPPPAPGPRACGPDPTPEDALPFCEYEACAE